MITAEEFSDGKFDLPEGGRWHELVAGEIQQLDPPDPIHGTVVLNLTKALAEFLDTANQEAAIAPQAAYACYELGLVVRRDPDTVLCPAVSVFVGGDAFAEMDKEVSESRPGMVIEVASSNLRRAGMADRVIEWHGWGVKNVWVVNPEDRSVHVADRGSLIRVATSTDTVSGDPVLPGLNIPVEDLFVEPAWWTSPPRPDSDPDGS
ncbi:MAG: Uma2 family endonuclease [Planctomycetaceae bacterium]|jgi:Uma2 family endonuclease|nr:Uma2 family endonuclease [Planctomycetaceae bacterium]